MTLMASIIISSKDFNNLSNWLSTGDITSIPRILLKIGNENSEKQINTEESEQDYAENSLKNKLTI